MKLQEQLSKRRGTKEYSKYVVSIPPELIKKLRWIPGQELKPVRTGRKLLLSPN